MSVTLSLQLAVIGALVARSLPGQPALAFTKTFYNVTVSENSVSRTLACCADRMGLPRHSYDDDVTFRIVSGDPDRIFKAESKVVGDFIFMVLRTRSGHSVVLNRERKDKFVLTVKAFSTRTSIEATTIVYVRVLDQNDLSPIFFPPKYNETIPEDFGLYRSILKVSAEDADLGVNGEVFYWIKEPTEYFAVHPSTGVVTLTKRLKYSERSIHDLTIVAQDRATIFRGGGQSSLALASVRVRQVNLFGPEIYVYVLQEPTEHRLGRIYALVRVMDRDDGVNGDISDIKIVNGDSRGVFILDPVTVNANSSKIEYNIILTNIISLERRLHMFNLSLQVTDKGFPQRQSYKTAYLEVNRGFNIEPKFQHEFYELNVPEYILQGSPLLHLTLVNRDEFLPNELGFSFNEGNIGNVFRIDSRTHTLYLASYLDSEKQRTFSLDIFVYRVDNSYSKETSNLKVKVNVVDCNDNNPVFSDLPEEVWVSENQPAGTNVLKVTAADADLGDNGVITYSIANLNFIPFEIDAQSGVLRTTQPLEYESVIRSFTLKIRASDSGVPFRRQSEKMIKVHTKNINDNKPEFMKGECSLSIPYNLKLGSELFYLTATDMDDVDVITYRLASSNNKPCIQIDNSNGLLSLQCDLSNVSNVEWELNVTASDGVYSSSTSVRVFVASSNIVTSESTLVQYSCRDIESSKEYFNNYNNVSNTNNHNHIESIDFEMIKTRTNENLNDPVISELPRIISVEESAKINSSVIQINASDGDTGFNGKLVFGLACEPEDFVFKIDPDSGMITVFRTLNFHENNEFFLNVSVCDQGTQTRCSRDSLTVNVIDVIERPVFKERLHRVHLKEDSKLGTEVTKIEVRDNGYGFTQNTSYHLISGSKQFDVDPKTGSIVLKASLDREEIELHKITVRASIDNLGRDSLHSDAVVTVYVDDVNDEAPSIANTRLAVNVREDLTPGSVVFVISAIDKDLGPGGEILFSLLDSDVFSVDATTGTVRLRGRLDYEAERVHLVTLQASDRGDPPLSAQATLTVIVTDVNENLHPPVFDELVILMTVEENLPAGTVLGSIFASDMDPPGDDSKISYGILEGSGLGLFSITEQGTIRTAAVLDAEEADRHWLTAVARDHGTLPLSATIQVYITVSDVDDNLPLTADPEYRMRMEENLPSHSVVGRMTAVDGDVTAHNVTYALLHLAKLPFNVHATTGVISTTALLDREDISEYNIQVVVSSGGSMSSTTLVHISVADVNDNTPQFEESVYHARPAQPPQPLPDNFIVQEIEQVSPDGERWTSSRLLVTEKTAPFFQVLAVDADDDDVTYSVLAGSPFLVDSASGLIYTRKRLKTSHEYNVVVRAVDGGVPSRWSTTRVSLLTPAGPRTLARRPDGALQVAVSEGLRPGGWIAWLNTSAPHDVHTTYTITGGTGVGQLATRGSSLLAAGRLDSESADSLGLTISANNLTHTWNIQVSLRVDDVNEWAPRFSSGEFRAIAREDAVEGSVLLTLQATDPDLTSALTFGLHDHRPGSDMFDVDPVSGDVVLTSPLDRERAASHQLTVAVSDGVRRSLARVLIEVEDVNDHPPLWPAPSLAVRLAEDSPPGTLVDTLVATDRDLGRNGIIEYYIISGNTNSTLSIDKETGGLRVAKPLDRTRAWSGEHRWVVRAVDGGTPPLHSDLDVRLVLVPSELRIPICLEEAAWNEVSGRVSAGAVVAATPVDVAALPSLSFELVGGDPRDLFLVSPVTGDVTVRRPVDRHDCATCNLTVRVTTMAGVHSECSVTIHMPEAEAEADAVRLRQGHYSGWVSEDVSPGALLRTAHGPLRVRPLAPTQAPLHYRLMGPHRDLITIDPFTGAVRTAKSLDYEQGAVLELRLSVADADNVNPTLVSWEGEVDGEASLTVRIKDVNDCPPAFSRSSYNATVLLPCNKDTLVIQVTGSDGDSEEVTSLSYAIVSGNEDQALNMDPTTGAIYVQQPLTLNPRRLQVAVSDGLHNANAEVVVEVRQRGASPLQFQRPLYRAAVLENSTSAGSVVAVVAVAGDRLGEVVTFSIVERCPLFAVGNTSGVVTTGGALLDREARDSYQFTVQAYSWDRSVSAVTTVNVSVVDANDNCPRFLNTPYRANLAQNSSKGDFVFKVVAKDADSGDNGEVRYELDAAGSEVFRINRRSGEIRLRSPTGPRSDARLTVTANDGGIVACSSSTVVVVSVVDADAPLWQRTVYRAEVSEAAPLLSAVPVALKATSANKVFYQLVNNDNFLLRHDTGSLQVTASLDRESVSHIELTVRATDVVTGHSSDTLLLLEVQDVNDCYPVFLQDSYEVHVPEDAELGFNITTVTATDADEGASGFVRYSSSDARFSVDGDGRVTLAAALDHEADTRHLVTVVATDSGSPPLATRVALYVHVVNTNDNPPELDEGQGGAVSEDAGRGALVGRLVARDRDADNLTYWITTRDSGFTIDRRTGLISVAGRRAPGAAMLEVAVDDGLHSVRGLFLATVLPTGRRAPQFDRAVYRAALRENSPAGPVIRVSASDGDPGLCGNVTYSLPPQRVSRFFTINETTGLIRSVAPLDREMDPAPELTVAAADGSGRLGWAAVLLDVQDDNDHPPRFGLPRYWACLPHRAPTGMQLLQVQSWDPDEGPAGEAVYSITTVEPRRARPWFHLHPQLATVTVSSPPDADDVQIVVLTIRATDGGHPPLHSEVTVNVVMLPHEHPPTLLSYLPSKLIIPSTATPGHVIHRFKSFGSAKAEFRLVVGEGEGEGEAWLRVNASGHLLLLGRPPPPPPALTRRLVGLLATAPGKPPLNCAFKQITVETSFDVKAAPVFVVDTVEITIPEDTPVGSSIFRVSTLSELPVLFGLTPANAPPFAVDPLTGWLTVAAPLDREAQAVHRLTVKATASASGLTTTMALRVNLSDCNDNPHIFNQDQYQAAVKEDAAVGTVVARLSLTDPDERGDSLRALVTGGDSAAAFGVTGDLQVVVARPLDRELTADYRLTVTATDGTFAAHTTVNVRLIDVNDWPPRCVRSSYEASVSEARPPGHLVATLATEDPDVDGGLRFRLVGPGAERFTIDDHGEVRLAHYLDREHTSEYVLDAVAEDAARPARRCSSRLRVHVVDVNDSPPVFVSPNETVTLTEDAPPGLLLTRLHAFDLDAGVNRQVHFTLVGSSSPGLFAVSASGLVTLAQPLQSSPGSLHSLTARAADRGTPPLAALTTVQVVVLGMSDDPPASVSGDVHVAVSEDAAPGTDLLRVRPFGEGGGDGQATVLYTILEGNGYGEFEIDKKTGVLSTVKSLDRESRQSYQLLVLSTRLGDAPPGPPFYTAVNVTVTDVNDNPPTFKVNRYAARLREDVAVGQIVLKVEADDIDSGWNGMVRFSLDAEASKHFAIDSRSGVLTVANPLDREQVAQHVILARATDGGSPPLSSAATLTIDVTDVNDNPPVFLHPNATAILQADRMPGWEVFHFAATDADSSGGDRFAFAVTGGAARGEFRLDADGTLRTTDRLALAAGRTFALRVRVDDGGSPNLHSTTWLNIKVVEPSKHPPELLPLHVWVGVYERQWRGGELGHVTATDLDQYDRLEYSTPGTQLFAIEARLGTLKARAGLAPGHHSVNVTVTDGKFTSSGMVNVTVETLSQDMLQTSVYIRLSPRVRAAALALKLPVFLSTLRSAFLRDVTLISAQDNNSSIGLLIAVAGGADLHVVREVMSSAGLAGTTPQCDCLNGGLCQRQLLMLPDRHALIAAPTRAYVTPGHSLAYYCICSMGYAGDRCEEVKCLCPPLQVCVPQRVGFTCMPPCSANQTCPAQMTSQISWSEAVTCLLAIVAIVVAIVIILIYRKYKNADGGERKYGSWGKQNCYINKRKAKLSNLEASQKPIFTGSPNNGTLSRCNNLAECAPGGVAATDSGDAATPLDYLRNINHPKIGNDILQGHSSAPDLATCHAATSFLPDDPARELAALDDQLSQEVIEYGFPPPGAPPSIKHQTEQQQLSLPL